MSVIARNLDIVKAHRDQIMLAEVVGLLHNLGKLHADFLLVQASDRNAAAPPGFTYRYEILDNPKATIAVKLASSDITGRQGRDLMQALLSGAYWGTSGPL